ncbi:MAG: calcineurin-like phosphoesterase C-terminal domain-containing protein [Alphaproteobacteria bacterium]
MPTIVPPRTAAPILKTLAAITAVTVSACAGVPDTSPGTAKQDTGPARSIAPYFATIEVIPSADETPGLAVSGAVFHDRNRDGKRQEAEPGVAEVLVSNGRDVVRTNRQGIYRLPARSDMSVSVVQPRGWRTPTDENWVPQFAYEHKPGGSPKAFRFGGLEPTGPLPEAVNFPLVPAPEHDRFSCAVLGDTQAYSNAEISHVRDTVIDDLADRRDGQIDCLLFLGDVVGDDLGLIPRMAEVTGSLGVPQYWVHGNHDFDFDADRDADSTDTWRRLWGPAYYAFEMGDAVFIALDNVVYPCGEEDAKRPGREYCVEGNRKRYNGRVPEPQMIWLRNLVNALPADKRIILAHHIPFVSFVDQSSVTHQTDNVTEIHALLEGRKALSLSGHTHTIENHQPGDHYHGWSEAVGVETLPFPHIVAGAVSGGWWHGDFDVDGAPMALQRLGGPRGWLDLTFSGSDFVDTYYATNLAPDRRMWLGLNTPGFRSWFERIMAWRAEDRETRDPVPPRTIADLPDPKILTLEDLYGGVYLTANVWNGSSASTVTVQINDGRAVPMIRTQRARGEEAKTGALYADPFAATRQLTVARFAYESRSGIERHQGYEAFRGGRFGPAAPQPQTSVADRSSHLWRHQLPQVLPFGTHIATVTHRDDHGRETTDRLVFEVRENRPPALWRQDVWDRFEDGPPVR